VYSACANQNRTSRSVDRLGAHQEKDQPISGWSFHQKPFFWRLQHHLKPGGMLGLNLPSFTLNACLNAPGSSIGGVVFHVRLAVSSRILRGTCTRPWIVDTRHAMRT
jgi:hypothetical protein